MGLYFVTKRGANTDLALDLTAVGEWYGFQLGVQDGRVVVGGTTGRGYASAEDSALFLAAINDAVEHDFDADSASLNRILGAGLWEHLLGPPAQEQMPEGIELHFARKLALGVVAKGIEVAGASAQVATGGALASVPTPATIALGGYIAADGGSALMGALTGHDPVGNLYSDAFGVSAGPWVRFGVNTAAGLAGGAIARGPKLPGASLPSRSAGAAARIRIAGGDVDTIKGIIIRSGGYDPSTGTVYVGRGGHFGGMRAAGGTPKPTVTPGITVYETESAVFWANDSMSLGRALTAGEAAGVQAAMQAQFAGKTVKQVLGFREAMQAIQGAK